MTTMGSANPGDDGDERVIVRKRRPRVAAIDGKGVLPRWLVLSNRQLDGTMSHHTNEGGSAN